MKKLLILIVVLCVATALALPAAIGWLVQDRAERSLRENWPDAELQWQRGWIRSSVEIDAGAWRGRIELRQLPLSPPGLLALSGRITLSEPAAVIELKGSVSPGLALQLQLDTAAIAVQTQALWQWDAPRAVIDTGRDGRLALDLTAGRLNVHDALGNRITLEQPRLRLNVEPESEQSTSIELQFEASRLDQAPSRLALQAESVDREAMALLLDSGRELARSEPDSTAAGLAALGALGAWQQLVAGGLQMRLAPLELDPAFRLEGTWHPAERRLDLAGGGPEKTLLDWAEPIIGLQQQLSPAIARDLARSWLSELQTQVGIHRDAGQLRIDIQRP
jgi:hypothetical protein